MNNTDDNSLYTVQVEVNAHEREIISRRLGRAVGCVPRAEIEIFLREALYARLAAVSDTVVTRRRPVDIAAEVERGDEHGVVVGQRLYRTLRERIVHAGESDEFDRRRILEDLVGTLDEIADRDATLADILADRLITALDSNDDRPHVGLLIRLAYLRRKLEERRALPRQPCPLRSAAQFPRTRDDDAHTLFRRALVASGADDGTADAHDLSALARAAEVFDPPLAPDLYDRHATALVADADAEIEAAERAAVERRDWDTDRYQLLMLNCAARDLHGLGRTERAVACFEAGRRIVDAYEYEAYEEGGYADLLELIRRSPPEVREACAGMVAEIKERLAEHERQRIDEDEQAREEERERQRRLDHEMARIAHEAGDVGYDEADLSGIG